MGTTPSPNTPSALGRLLVIANPTSQSGRGEAAACQVEEFLEANPQATSGYEVRRTERAGHAREMAAAIEGFDTVVALGGDGIIHEVVNGIMELPRNARPALGVVSIGSGNDYARTVGMAINRPLQAMQQLVGAHARPFDVGRVNGVHFMETLSFGLDAAIALGTVERRVKSKSHGTALYGSTGFDVFIHNREPFHYVADLWRPGANEATHLEGDQLIFAVQVGPTYGGGFKVCPEADPDDGLLDLCYTVTVPALPVTLGLFCLARLGLHRNSKVVRFERLSKLSIAFDSEPPCQVDGEKLTGKSFEVDCVPGAIDVLVP